MVSVRHCPFRTHLTRQPRRLWAHADGKGFNQKLDYLPLNGAEIVIRVIGDDAQADGNGGAQ